MVIELSGMNTLSCKFPRGVWYALSPVLGTAGQYSVLVGFCGHEASISSSLQHLDFLVKYIS